jgi:hypothetical protein
VPHAFKLDKEHAKDGLVVILDESQATKDRADLVGFVTQNFIKYGQYSTSNVFITNSESPFPNGSSGIPFAALIGIDGKLLLIGNPSGWGKKLDEAIEPEFKKIKSGWGKSAEAKKVRSLMYGKTQLGEAANALAAAEGKIKDDAKEDFDEAKIELDTRYTGLKDAIKALMEQGRFIDAKAAATNLAKAVKGKAEWETEAAALVADFAKPEIEKELALDKTLTGVLKSIGDKRPTEDHVKKFKDLAKKNDGTKVGARAAEFAAACEWKDPAVKSSKDKDKEEKEEKDAKDKPKSGG